MSEIKKRRGPAVKVGDPVQYTTPGGGHFAATISDKRKYGIVDLTVQHSNCRVRVANVPYNPSASARHSWRK